MSQVKVYDRPEPTEKYKKKKFAAYTVAGVFVVLTSLLIWTQYFYDAPTMNSGEDSMGEVTNESLNAPVTDTTTPSETTPTPGETP